VYEQIEKPLIPIAAAMQERGVLVDTTVLAQLATTYRAELEMLEKKIHHAAGNDFNISSPKQLAVILFDELKLIPEKQRKQQAASGPRARASWRKFAPHIRLSLTFSSIAVEEITLHLYRQHSTASRRTPSAPREFLQTGTTTGRMSSQNPNLQNIPLHSGARQAIRHAFVASHGFTLLALDYSQVELRIAAILSGDEKLCAIFKNGRDVHTEVASMVFGVSAEKVDQENASSGESDQLWHSLWHGRQRAPRTTRLNHRRGASISRRLFQHFQNARRISREHARFRTKHGYTETLFGRRRGFPEMNRPCLMSARKQSGWRSTRRFRVRRQIL